MKDVDLDRNRITVRGGEGDRHRLTMLPGAENAELSAHLAEVRALHERYLADGVGWAELLGTLGHKLPSARREWPSPWLFPATRTYLDPESGERRRHNLHGTVVQQAVRRAALAAEIPKGATCHTFWPSFATYPLEGGSDARTVEELLRRRNLATTVNYTHVLHRGPAPGVLPTDCSRADSMLRARWRTRRGRSEVDAGERREGRSSSARPMDHRHRKPRSDARRECATATARAESGGSGRCVRVR